MQAPPAPALDCRANAKEGTGVRALNGRLAAVAAAAALVGFAGCGDEVDQAQDQIDDAQNQVEDAQDAVEDPAGEAQEQLEQEAQEQLQGEGGE